MTATNARPAAELAQPARRRAAAGLATLVLLVLPVFVSPGRAEDLPAASAATLKQVESRFVCMVNDAVFDREQIPVEVDGRTYFGCCPMCKQRLAEDPAARQAKDPVTGELVDKATAVVAARPDGSVLYFASAKTLSDYVERQAGAGEPETEVEVGGQEQPSSPAARQPSGDHGGSGGAGRSRS